MERNEVRIVTKLKIPIAVVAIAMVIYHLISTQYLVVSSLEHQNIHLGFTLIFVFLFAMQGYKKRLWPLFLLATFIVFSVIAIGYIHIFHDELIERIGFPYLFRCLYRHNIGYSGPRRNQTSLRDCSSLNFAYICSLYCLWLSSSRSFLHEAIQF